VLLGIDGLLTSGVLGLRAGIRTLRELRSTTDRFDTIGR
jgi:hypothetical protein